MSSPPEPRPRLRDAYRAMPRTAWILFAGTFVHRLASFVFPFLALYLTRRGLSVTQAGLAISAYGVGGVLAQLSGGLLTDRVGRRNAIAISMIASAILVLLVLAARSLPTVLAAVIAYSFFAELHRPASSALVADLFPPEQRVPAYAFYRLLINLAFAIGLAVGGFLAERSFTLLFAIDAASSAVFGVLSLIALPHGTRTRRAEEREIGGARAAIFADTGFMIALLGILGAALVYSQVYSTFPLWIHDLGYEPKVYGLLQSENGFLVVLLELGIGAIAMRFPRTRMIALGSLLLGIGFGAHAVLLSAIGLGVAVAIWTIGEIAGSASSAAFVADRAPPHLRGRYQSSLGIVYGLGFTLGPLGGTTLYRAWPRGVWVACLALGVLGAALVLVAERRPTPSPVP